ncbi:unnamed protein product [Urochloa decumbens]|uniref:Rhodanese domain-containing protein n=1 Tax=Urochloa decumbens TaxID=240449 RepID=A0ABC8VGP9_9POAL
MAQTDCCGGYVSSIYISSIPTFLSWPDCPWMELMTNNLYCICMHVLSMDILNTYATRSSESVVTTVDVAAARELISPAGGHRYLDVRTEEELTRLGHLVEVDGSLNVPYMFITPQGSRVKNAQFVEQVASLFTKDEQVVVGCQSGKRSELACIDLQAAGFKNVKNMGGGYLAWLDHGFPVYHINHSPPAQGTA